MEHLLYWSSALSRSSLSRVLSTKKTKVSFPGLRHLKGTGKSNVSILLRRIKILYSNGKDTRAKLCQPGDMIVVAPDPKDIVVIIALTELLFDLWRTNHDVEPFNDINGMSFISLFGMHCKIVSVGPEYMLTNKKEHEMPLLFFYLESLLLSGVRWYPRPNQELQWVLVSSPHARGNLDRLYVLYSRVKTPSVKSKKKKEKRKKCGFYHQFYLKDSRVLSTIDLRNDGVSSTCLPFPVTARFPSTSRAFPSLSQSAGEGSSRAPLTSEDLPLLSQLRRDFIEVCLQVRKGIAIGIINSTSAVPGAAERDALAVEAKKGIEVRLA
ncbi:hypothetical protein L1987_88633 [Smallanthus sonchifolius]|nr:hypothetical protein L1987_88633 [Smallanthus sonchifolius]